MKLCAAQLRAIPGDVPRNLEHHLDICQQAATLGVDVLLFPELSLTGYEPTLAADLGVEPDDSRLEVFQAFSDRHVMVLGVGVPTRSEGAVLISMVIFQPQRPRLVYSKQQLHADEQAFFVAGTVSSVLQRAEQRLALAICFESLQADHAQQAADAGATVYLTSVAKSAKGVAAAAAHYPVIARQHRMTVIMANCVGPADDYQAAGQSGVWDASGERLCAAGASDEALVLFDTLTSQAEVVPIAVTAGD